jgi:hypothetical protein
MSKNHVCGICGKDKSPFVMNNKQVCMRCDELLFDMEIECEEIATSPSDTAKPTIAPGQTNIDKKVVR